jgi:transcriptional regulator with XRE-family HTH domain
MSKTSSQGSEILAICQRLGLTPAQLADRVPMKAETMRKVVRGYQPASERTMQNIRNIEQMLTRNPEAPAGQSAPTGSAYGIMQRETLQQNFAEVAEQLQQAEPPARRTLLNNLRAMLDELDRREPPATPPTAGNLTEAQRIALQASEKLEPAPAPPTAWPKLAA